MDYLYVEWGQGVDVSEGMFRGRRGYGHLKGLREAHDMETSQQVFHYPWKIEQER